MLELLLCSALTVLPDYLIRRIFQGKRFGKEIMKARCRGWDGNGRYSLQHIAVKGCCGKCKRGH